MVYNVSEKDPEPDVTSHINGSIDETLARYQITELCKGWPVYRDHSEWKNYRNLFTKEGAYVWTTWSGGLTIDDFIAVSKKGRAAGDQIMHRENGTLANVNLAKGRGIGKMKATITQRFQIDNIPVDVDCDCQFIFFTLKEEGEWKTQYVKLFYEKDKMVSIDGRMPKIPQDVLDQGTEGYKYLGFAQHTLGHKILPGLPNMNNKGWTDMYDAMGAWLKGEKIDLFWEHTS